MGIEDNNPQDECPDTSKCIHCRQPIRDLVIDKLMPYEIQGFCTVGCEAFWIRRELIRRGLYTLNRGLMI